MTVYTIYHLATAILLQLEFNFFSYMYTYEGRLRFSLGLIMFLLIHWEFTTHYLQASYLFQASIQAYNTGDDSLVVKRKFWLRLLEISVYAFFLVVFCFLTAFRRWDYWIICWSVIWLGLSCAMTLVTLFSWRHINKSSEALDQLGIQTNT